MSGECFSVAKDVQEAFAMTASTLNHFFLLSYPWTLQFPIVRDTQSGYFSKESTIPVYWKTQMRIPDLCRWNLGFGNTATPFPLCLLIFGLVQDPSSLLSENLSTRSRPWHCATWDSAHSTITHLALPQANMKHWLFCFFTQKGILLIKKDNVKPKIGANDQVLPNFLDQRASKAPGL